MSDLLSLLLLIRGWTGQIRKVTELIETMRSEGRETLTDDEKVQLQADDDDARNQLLDAIEAAEASAGG